MNDNHDSLMNYWNHVMPEKIIDIHGVLISFSFGNKRPLIEMRKPHQNRQRRVAVLIESSRQYGRMLDLGIARFTNEAGNWLVSFHEQLDWNKLPAWVHQWAGDGILIHSHRHADIQRLAQAGIPLVSLYEESREGPYSKFHQDNQAIARLAFGFFLKRGHRNIAFCGIKGLQFSKEREDFYAAEAAAYAMQPRIFNFRPHEITGAFFEDRANLARFLKWIRRQPRPLAIFACNDDLASLILFICKSQTIRIPEEAALLGVDDDPLRVSLVHPYLSSIETDAIRIGYEAARHLNAMMASGDRTPCTRLFPPLGIHERESTNVYPSDDPLVKAAMELIHHEPLQTLDVSGLAQRLSVSRKTLDTHFQAALRCNVHKILLTMKLQQIRMRVEQFSPELSMPEIAHEAGLSLTHFTRLFKQAFGLSPVEYRKSRDHLNR